MDRNVLNDIVNILCANIEKVHGVIITNGGVITNAYGMNKYEYLDRIVFSNEYMNNIILEYKDIKSIIEKGKADNSIQSCFISECGIEIIFHNNDLADKFTKSLNIPCISYVKAANKVLVYYIFD